jgi:hypothetical protein
VFFPTNGVYKKMFTMFSSRHCTICVYDFCETTRGFFVDFAAIKNGSQKASEVLWAAIVHRVLVHAPAEQSEGH